MHTFIGEPVEVVRSENALEPTRFRWRERTFDIRELLHAWSDWHFPEGSHRRSWRNRRHRNYYRVRTDDGVFELYVDRGVRGDSQHWVLLQRLDLVPPAPDDEQVPG